MRVWLALAYAANNQQTQACKMLIRALDDACAPNIQRIFIEGGEMLAILLRATLPLLIDKQTSAFAKTILHALPETAFTPEEPLSLQERRVLSLIVEGRSNVDIAADLVVSVNTVKAHVKNIYRKLHVNNRIEATRVTQLLDLL
jgi:LuxR family maltose regulon positive regulatory protein